MHPKSWDTVDLGSREGKVMEIVMEIVHNHIQSKSEMSSRLKLKPNLPK